MCTCACVCVCVCVCNVRFVVRTLVVHMMVVEVSLTVGFWVMYSWV